MNKECSMKIEDIRTIAVIGAGTMGLGIAQNFAEAGFQVKLFDQFPDAVDHAKDRIQANLGLFKEHGLITEGISSVMQRITVQTMENLTENIAFCQYVVECIPEILELKKDLFTQLRDTQKELILASNTSSFTMTPLADCVCHPERVVGLHYFNPAHIMPAVEIHKAEQTSQDTIDLTLALMRKVGKVPALVRKEVPGFIVNRLQGAVEREVDYLLDEEIVTPEDLDAIMKASYGFRLACLGPMEAEDVIGLDTSERVSDRIFKELSNKTEASPLLKEKVKNGELGIKSGKGWYDYQTRDMQEVQNAINNRLLAQLKLFKQANME